MLLIGSTKNQQIEHKDDVMLVKTILNKVEKFKSFVYGKCTFEKTAITSLTFCYFVAGYFYEIESALIHNETIQFLAHLGNGKGKVTRFYILRGLNKWINKTIVDEAIKEFNITPEQMEEIAKLAMMGI